MRDRELNRTLAMKVMLGAHSLSHRMRAGRDEGLRGSTPISHPLLTRFLEEVQVTAHLDHPDIVAVHELGLDAAGRPYFTIKLEKAWNYFLTLLDVGCFSAVRFSRIFPHSDLPLS